MAAKNLVLLFFTTAGQNAENLGSDEEQIASFVYMLYDIPNNKVRTWGLLKAIVIHFYFIPNTIFYYYMNVIYIYVWKYW